VRAVQDEVRANRRLRLRGEGGDDGSHRDLARLKVAGLIRLLDRQSGSTITEADWTLAGIVLDMSDRLRTQVLEGAELVKVLEDEEAGVRTDRRRRAEGDALLDRVAAVIARHAHGHRARPIGGRPPDAACSRRCLAKAVPGSDRRRVDMDAAIGRAVQQGWLADLGDEAGWIAGPSSPRQEGADRWGR
jgi:hypothetical protein